MAQRVIITGAAGRLGRQLVRAFAVAGHEVIELGRGELDLASPAAGEVVAALAPNVVVNAAAWTDVDGCARDPDRAMLLNGVAPGRLAGGAARSGALFVQISTNEVFDGNAERPYRERDSPHPINPYGASKLAGEEAVAVAAPNHLIVRTAWLFGPDGPSFVTKILAAADAAVARREPLTVVADEWGNPTWTPSLADAVLHAATTPQSERIVHLVGEPPTSRLGWARVIVEATRPGTAIEPTTRSAFARPSAVPARAVLRATDGLPPLSWEDETRTYARSLAANAATDVAPA